VADEITELCGYIYAATYQLLVKIREFDQNQLWAGVGVCSCAHWLNFRCGIGMNAAREKVRVANALGDLPLISAAFAKGEISYSKVRAMTRIATPENEDSLLLWAKHCTASQIESLSSKYRKAVRQQEMESANEQYVERKLSYFYDDDGSLVIKGRFPAEQGAMIVKALQMAIDRAEADTADVSAETPGLDVTEESWEPIAAKRADALMEMAESYLANGPKGSSSADRYQVMLHVSAETLVGASEAHDSSEQEISAETSPSPAEERSHIEDGPHVSAETSRRICCDAAISPITTGKNGAPLNIGRKSRTIPPAMRRALRTRDQGCSFPGCTHQHFIDGHHIEHWSDGGETSLDNLVLLCRHHHRLVHEGGFGCEKDVNGELVFSDQRGKPLGCSRTVTAIRTTPAAQRRIRERLENLHIDAQTCVSRWYGEQMDYSIATGHLWRRDFPED
jgi:hypothetical protein